MSALYGITFTDESHRSRNVHKLLTKTHLAGRILSSAIKAMMLFSQETPKPAFLDFLRVILALFYNLLFQRFLF